MGKLTLIRHGQASFLESNYDLLSPLGVAQSQRLGEAWLRGNLSFDRIVVGPCVRQRDTFAAVAATCLRGGHALPEPQLFPEFDEYPGEQILHWGLPRLLEQDEPLRAQHAAFQAAGSPVERSAAYQKVFEHVLGAWVSGALTSPEIESWPGFCARVNSGLDRILAGSRRGERVAVFTSGGCIGVAMQRALSLSRETTLQTSFLSRNSAWSEFLFSQSPQLRFTLSTFNAFGHIDDPALLTYR